jgi:hypothetical protein
VVSGIGPVVLLFLGQGFQWCEIDGFPSSYPDFMGHEHFGHNGFAGRSLCRCYEVDVLRIMLENPALYRIEFGKRESGVWRVRRRIHQLKLVANLYDLSRHVFLSLS